MKKQVVAFLLSMTLCSAMVVEAGASAVVDFAAPVVSEDVFSDSTAQDQEQTDESQTGNAPTENGTTGDIPAEGTEEIEGDDVTIEDSGESEEPSDEAFGDTVTDNNVTEDNIANGGAEAPTEDVSGDDTADTDAEVSTDEPAEEEAEPEVDFADGLFVSDDVNSVLAEDYAVEINDPAVMPAADFEFEDEAKHTATLLWSRWENENGKWKLQKLPKALKSASVPIAAESTVSVDALAEEEIVSPEADVPETSTDMDLTETEAAAGDAEVPEISSDGETETVDTEVMAADVTATDVQGAASETAVPEAAAVYSAAPEYYKNQLVTVTTVDDTNNELKEGTYYFDGNGYLVTGIKTVNKGTPGLAFNANTEFYFLEASKAKIESQLAANPKTAALYNSNTKTATPYNSNLGQMQKGTDELLWDGSRFHKYGEDGRAEKLNGIQTYKNASYYLQDGKPYDKGILYVKEKKSYYAFSTAKNSSGIPGQMIKNAWASRVIAKKGTQWLYFGNDGRYQKKPSGAYKLYSSSNARYLLNNSGYIVKSKMMKASNGYYYLSKSNGQVYANQVARYGKYRYYFVSDGRRYTGRNRWIKSKGNNNRYYYIGSTRGRVQNKKGIQKVTMNGKFIGWFLFSSSGNNYQDRWVGDRYYLPDGRMASGVRKVGKYYYFFERSSSKTYRGKRYKGKWIKYNNKYYYASKKGILAENGWRNIRLGKTMYRFYFQNCKVVTNKRMKDPKTNKYGWLDSRGRHVTGWIAMDNSRNRARYIDPKTGELYKNTVKTIDGKQYRFDKYGNRVTDRTSEFRQKGGSYYLECDRVNGVMTVYTNSRKTIPIKTIRVSVGNPWTPTKLMKNERIDRADRWQLLMGPSWGQYGTHVKGGIYIHSVACGQPHPNNLPAGEYLKLGNPASHGCIRCCVADAKWVWDNCNGSRITVFDGKYNSNECFKGPLGRNPLKPLRGNGTFDPTDPIYN